MIYRIYNILILLFLLLCNVAYANEATDINKLYNVSITEKSENEIDFALSIDENYYIYDNKSTAGLPTSVSVYKNNEKVNANIIYPKSSLKKDVFSGEEVETYQGKINILIEFPKSSNFNENKADYMAKLSMLMCSSEHCIPVNTEINLANAEIIKTEKTVGNYNFEVREFFATGVVSSLFVAILFGFLAGFILNFMPCVLPVLTLKISNLLGGIANANKPENIAKFRRYNIFFSLGVLTYFIFLGVLIGGLGLQWGSLFQSQYVVIALILLLVFLALSVFELCTLPIIDLKFSNSNNISSQAYFTGLAATLLATPCSGPLLGGVLAWSVSQPLYILLLVFISTGLGMASLYLLFAIFPKSVKLLPKPGNWLLWLERVIGVFLLATIIYLLQILNNELAVYVFIISLLTSLYFVCRKTKFNLVKLSKYLIALVFLCAIFLYVNRETKVIDNNWENFNIDSFSENLNKEAMLIEFTADWCPNCKLLEYTSLKAENLEKIKKQYGLKFIKVDITNYNDEAQKLLNSLDSISIPLTAIFNPEKPNSPLILRDIFSFESLEEALSNEFSK